MSNPFAGVTGPVSLLIITPDAFQFTASALVTHKNATGMPAMSVGINSIKSFFGTPVAGRPGLVDDAEAIKLAIKFAYENLSTRYVMLVGDAQNFPVRYWFGNECVVPLYPGTSIPVGSNPGGTFIQSDLYYANLYHHSGTFPNMVAGDFDYWNGTGTGLYNQSYMSSPPLTELNPDHVDGYPDLAVARVPAANVLEFYTYIYQIIAYENSHTGPISPSLTFVHDEQYGNLELTTDLAAEIKAAGWTGPTQFLLMENYPTVLSLAAFQGSLWMAYIAGDSSGGLLICSKTSATGWGPFVKTGQSSVTGPSLAVFAPGTSLPELWMAFVAKTAAGEGEICISSSADKWASNTPTGFFSKQTPALAVFKSSLFMAFVIDDDESDTIVTTSWDGTIWSPTSPIPNSSCAAPALAVFQPPGSPEPLLWMAFVTDNGLNDIYICSSADGKTNWSKNVLVTAVGTATPPSLAVFDGKLWLTFAADDGSGNVLVCSSADGTTWSAPVQILNQTSAASPGLAVFGNDELWVGFIGFQNNNLFVCSLGGPLRQAGELRTWKDYPQLPYSSVTAPAPFVMAGPPAIAKAAGQSFWVSYIGHGGPDGWGHMGIFTESDVLLTQNTSGLPIVFCTGCQTALFASNVPWGVISVDAGGNLRGPFNVAPSASPVNPGLVVYEGSPPPNHRQAWGIGPGFAQPAPSGSLTGNWSLPVNIPMPNVYNTPMDCIGKTWMMGSAPGGAIAYFGVHDVTNPDGDIEMEGYLLTYYLASAGSGIRLPNQPVSGRPVLGDLYLKAQRTYWANHQSDAATLGLDYHSIPRLYLGWLVFFGDPSLRLPVLSVETPPIAGGTTTGKINHPIVLQGPGIAPQTLAGIGGPPIVENPDK